MLGVAQAADGGVLVVGEFTGNVASSDATASSAPLTSQGVGSDGFFMKINKEGYIRHILHLRGGGATAITGVAYGGSRDGAYGEATATSTERVVLTARHAGASAELASVTTGTVLLNLTGDAAVTHAATFELEYQMGTTGSVDGDMYPNWALFVNGGAAESAGEPAATAERASALQGDRGGAYATGVVYGTTGDYKLVTFIADGGCEASGSFNSFCSGNIPGLHGQRDAWVAKVAPRRGRTTPYSASPAWRCAAPTAARFVPVNTGNVISRLER